MGDKILHYIDGKWVEPIERAFIDVIDPATGKPTGQIAAGSQADVDRAVVAARKAFETFSRTSIDERLALLERMIECFKQRQVDVGAAVRRGMGAPTWLADGFQSLLGVIQLEQTRDALRALAIDTLSGTSMLTHEPIGVCGLITPWNWPVNLVVIKVAPAIATGCTVVLKPSEVSPYDSAIFAEILEAAGVPPGVFNLVNGTGAAVGNAISGHPDIDLVSFTGSVRAGVEVARNAAPTVKRVLQELGGKSPNILLEDVDLEGAVGRCVDSLMTNTGQTCNAPSRMFVPRRFHDEAAKIAGKAADAWTVGPPEGNVRMGPVATAAQWQKIQDLVQSGIDEGATLVTGGTGRPEGLDEGYYAKPTVFANVTHDMRIAKEEIFGPVLSIMPYDTENEAIAMANDTEYGLAGYVNGNNIERCREVARQLRAGQIFINAAENDFTMPFGGYKKSGNGREWGSIGLSEYLEVKAIIGYGDHSPVLQAAS
jgi:aldehyde dehydrogenase (NAD+)